MRVIHLEVEHVVLAEFIGAVYLHVIFLRSIATPLPHGNLNHIAQTIVNILGAVILALVQIVDHPAPFIVLPHITALHEELCCIDSLVSLVVFIEIVFINEKAGRNHIEIASVIDPETVGQVSIDSFICSLDHPIVILPFDEKIRIAVVIVLPPALRIIRSRNQPSPVVLQPLDAIIHILLPCTGKISSIKCCPFCRRHSEVALEFCPCLHNQPSSSGIRIELLRRIAAVREVAITRFVIIAKKQAAGTDGGGNLDGGLFSAEGARPDLGGSMCARRFLRHDVDDAADESARKASRDVAAVDLDALDIADGDRRDIDRRIAAEVRQHAVDEYADLCRRRAAYGDRRILPLALHLAHMHAGNHLEKVRQRLLFALELLRAYNGHSAGRKGLFPFRPPRLHSDVLHCIFQRRICTLLWNIRPLRTLVLDA